MTKTTIPDGRWCVYIVRCQDDTLYTGCTNHLEARVQAHNKGQGAKYTRKRLPVKLVWWQPAADRSHALRLEHEVKTLGRERKLKLIEEDPV